MKRILFLFLIMASMTVVAQESIPQDTTLYLNGRKVVIKERDGKIKVKMYEAKAENDTIENTQVFEGVYLDGRSIERTTTVSVPFVKKKKGYYRFDPHYPAIYSVLTSWQTVRSNILPKYHNLALSLGNGELICSIPA